MDRDRRYIKETGLEARIATIAAPVAESLGYRLVRVRVSSLNGMTVQVMAEDSDGQFSISDCERLSHDLSPVLDADDPVDRAYHLEVSSPGIDRPLVRLEDFSRWVGHEAKIETHELINHRRRYRGDIVGVEDADILIRLPDAPAGTDPVARVPAAEIAEAKLLLTDKLIADSKSRMKHDPLSDPSVEREEELGV